MNQSKQQTTAALIIVAAPILAPLAMAVIAWAFNL